MKLSPLIPVLLAAILTGGCSMLPTAGPASAYVLAGQLDPESLPYNVVRITPEVELILERGSPKIGQVFTDRRGPSEIRFGIGDVVSVTLPRSPDGVIVMTLLATVVNGPLSV